MFLHARRAVLAALFVLLLPVAARAVTLDDIIALSKAGVTADILVAVINADQTIFNLNTDEIVLLTKAGVPNAVIVKMLGTAREFVEEVPPPLIVGTERPSAPESSPVPTFGAGGPYPYFTSPVPVFVAPFYPGAFPGVVPGVITQPARGFGRFMNNGFVTGRGPGRFINDGFVDPPRRPAK
jgi:hypothetical protein